MIGPWKFGYLLEGTQALIGIEKATSPSFYGRCRVCGWRGTREEHEDDASRALQQHLALTVHQERVMRLAGREFEKTLFAKEDA